MLSENKAPTHSWAPRPAVGVTLAAVKERVLGGGRRREGAGRDCHGENGGLASWVRSGGKAPVQGLPTITKAERA